MKVAIEAALEAAMEAAKVVAIANWPANMETQVTATMSLVQIASKDNTTDYDLYKRNEELII